MENKETEIWDSFVGGSESALKELHEAYYEALLRYGYQFTPDVHLLQDAVQILFVKLWENRRGLDRPASVKNYLYKAFRNTLINQIRASNRRATIPLDEDLPFGSESPAEEMLILSEVEKERKRIVDKKLQQLTNRQREAIYLRFYLGLTYEDMANLLDIDKGGAYKLIHRAIDRLRNRD